MRCSTFIENFFDFFSIEPEEDTDATTVNGWITEIIGDIPEQGHSFDYKNLTITITKADDLMAHEITVRINENSTDIPEETT